MIGRSLAHYSIIEKLGEGGMGAVYKARDERLDRFVALKILPADKMSDPERRRRFTQEAKSASALNHPNIVTIYDIGEADGVHFIAMEYVEGRTLDGLIGRKELPLKDALEIAVQIADGLGKAHAAGIVHRDLKPSNIMVTPDRLVKVLDFGLAKLLEKAGPAPDVGATMTMRRTPATEEGVILGTVAYMSPEQAAGKPVDARSDIFSFGSVLYEMLTGRRAFEGETKASTLAAVIAREPAAPSEAAAPLPAEVARVVMRCLRKDPQRRWQNMADLKVALQDLKEESESGQLSAAETPAPAKRRSRLVPVLSGAAVLAAAGIIALLILRPRPGPVMAQPERITFESGLSFWPAISPDGSMIAYSSNPDGNMDIYVRQLSGRQSIRRTQHPAPDWFASFSPDGSKIVFRSERDGGGLYAMEALGGPERRIADGGRLPSFSPDGSTIVYIISAALTRQAKLFLIPADGGTPRPFQPEFVVLPRGASHSSPLWSADGKHILFDGMRPGEAASRGWWLAPVEGGPAVRIEPPAFGRQWVRVLSAWWHNNVYYSEGSTIGGMSLFRVPLSAGTHPETGPPQLVTSPAGMQYGASISAAGRMVFSTMHPRLNVWSVPLDQGTGTAAGPPEPVTSDSLGKLDFSLSGDGSKIAWTCYTMQQTEIRVRDTTTGREESIVCSNNTLVLFPRLSHDGTRLAYSDVVDGKRVAYISESGATPRPITGAGIILGFFSKADEVLAVSGDRLDRLDLAGTRLATVLDTTGRGKLEDVALSPSNRSLAFTLALPDGTAALYLASVSNRPAAAETWTKIDEDRNFIGSPAWARDGKTLYYGSNRDGFLCAWARRIGGDGKPSGPPFAAFHNHTPPDMVLYGMYAVRAASDRLYVLLSEFKGDLWSLKLPR